MKEDLIKRRDAIKALLNLQIFGCVSKHEAVGKCVATIMGLPSTDRPSGEWIHNPNGIDRDFIWWKCSKCGHVIYSESEHDREEFHAFCGRCGARMKDVTEGLESRTDLIWYGDKTDLIGDETGRHTGWFGKGADDEDN